MKNRRRSVICALVLVSSLAVLTLRAQVGSLISEWKAESDFSDGVGGNNGSATGGVSFSPGVSGEAFQFSGTPGQSIYVPYNANLDLQAFTVEVFVQPEGPSSNPDDFGAALVQKIVDGDSGLHANYAIWLNSAGIISAGVDTGGSADVNAIQAIDVIPNGQFSRVDLTYDGAVFKLYVNSQLQGQRTLVGPLTYTPGPLMIGGTAPGAQNLGFSRVLNGRLDEIRIFNQVLIPSDVPTNATACKSGGWRHLHRFDGSTFKNQGDCVQYVNTGR